MEACNSAGGMFASHQSVLAPTKASSNSPSTRTRTAVCAGSILGAERSVAERVLGSRAELVCGRVKGVERGLVGGRKGDGDLPRRGIVSWCEGKLGRRGKGSRELLDEAA
jgi:hypothetical protein